VKKQVTIAIPVYNSGNWIGETLESILNQTATIDQILICDNHSTDNTISVVKKFMSNNGDKNIKLYINEKNIGAYANLNRCYELSNTEYALLLHADDRLKPNAIEKLLAFYEKHPDIAFVGGQSDFIDQDGNLIGKAKKKEDYLFQKGEILEFYTKIGVFFHPATILYNMKYRDLFLFDIKEIGGDEKQFIVTLLEHSFAVLGDAITDNRIHLGQAGTREHLRFNDRIEYYERTLSFANYESSPERIRKTRKFLKDWLASQAIVVGKSVWRNFGEKQMGIKYWLYGLKKNPGYYFRRYISGPVKKPIKRLLNK
jgi:glycosyltransferase involved in cell wall biosynthesis